MIKDFVALDTETTGLSYEKERIIEIGAVRVEDGRVRETYSRLIACPRPLEPRITALTGITDEMLKDAPPLESVMPEFVRFCGEDVIVGHSLMFDYRFLKIAARSCRLSFEKQGVDTLTLARRLHPELPSKTLGAMCSYYGIKDVRFHRALEDAAATAALLLAMQACYPESELFEPERLIFKAKPPRPATNKQKAYLKELLKYHKIECCTDIDALSMSEVSRMTDQIIRQMGRPAAFRRTER